MSDGDRQGPVRVTVWGENVHERAEERRARAVSAWDARRDRRRRGRAAGRAGARAHRDARGARARAHPGRAGRHGRADLVGTRQPTRRSTTPSWTACTTRCSAAWGCSPCTRPTTRRSSAACSAHRAACGGGTTASASWCGPWTPAHPIAAGVPQPIVIDAHEMYGEHFDIPAPDELVFISSFAGGEVFRGGCCFRRGAGRIFYFSPGDQEYPIYHHPDVQRVIANAVEWAAPRRASGVPSPAASSPRAAGSRTRARDDDPAGAGAARGRDRRRVGGPAASRRLRGASGRARRGDRRARGARSRGARRPVRGGAPRRSLGGPARGGRPGRSQRRGADLHACADRDRRARARHARALGEADRAHGDRGALDGRGGAEGRSRPRRRLQPSPAGRHPEAQGGHRRRPAGAAVLRQGVVASPHRDTDPGQLVHAGRSGRRRAARRHRRARARLLAVPARQPRRQRRERVDLRPSRQLGLRLEPHSRPSRGRPARRPSTSRTSPPCSCAWRTGPRC